ncbi:MAG: hypothetical protein FWF72_01645 [Paludibacter sp.]|nr:hypothetical protein [Paludibacter sp.]
MFNKKKNNIGNIGGNDNNDVAAIASTLNAIRGNGDFAAIAATIMQFLGVAHDVESNILTICRARPAFETQWNAKYLGFNKLIK